MLHPMRFTGSLVEVNGASKDGWEMILGSMKKLLEICGKFQLFNLVNRGKDIKCSLNHKSGYSRSFLIKDK